MRTVIFRFAMIMLHTLFVTMDFTWLGTCQMVVEKIYSIATDRCRNSIEWVTWY